MSRARSGMTLERPDRIFRGAVRSIGTTVLVITGLIGVFLGLTTFPTLRAYGLHFFTQNQFLPSENIVGIASALLGHVRDRNHCAVDRVPAGPFHCALHHRILPDLAARAARVARRPDGGRSQRHRRSMGAVSAATKGFVRRQVVRPVARLGAVPARQDGIAHGRPRWRRRPLSSHRSSPGWSSHSW